MQVSLNQVLKWGIFTLTAVFLGQTAFTHWQEVEALELSNASGLWIAMAIALIVSSEWVAGLLWHWILDSLQQPLPLHWTVSTFFKTTLAKYLPGNVWHLVGRVHASKSYGVPLEIVSLSVLLEPLFMIAGGLIVALLCLHYLAIQVLTLGLVLCLLHPWGINQFFRIAQRLKGETSYPLVMVRYPWREILGGGLFMLLRGSAFCFTLACFQSFQFFSAPEFVSGFSLSWLLSIVLPAPGGIGIFESAAIQVLDGLANPGILLSTVLLYRMLCIISEVIGVGLMAAYSFFAKQIKFNYHSLRATLIPSTN